MKDKLSKFIQTNKRAFVVGDVKNKNLYYCNEQMTNVYGVTLETKDFMNIFVAEDRLLKKLLIKQLRKNESSFFYDIMTVRADGTHQLADLQIGYINRANSEMFMEITPKNDTRMEMAQNQVNLATRAESIVNFDEKLSLIHCNDLFHAVFESNEAVRHSHYGNDFSNGFQPDIREKLLSDIHTNLNKFPTYFTKMRIVTSSGQEKWYALELQRRRLDSSGEDKVMVYLVNIENQVEMEEELADVNRQFDALQQLSDDLIFRIDTKNKKLIIDEVDNTLYKIKEKVSSFPDDIINSGSIHPNDISIYEYFANQVYKGRAGSVEVRMKEYDDDDDCFQYRRITWLPVVENDDTFSEVVGKLVNVQTVKELEERANYDALTNTLNKRAMLEYTSQVLANSTNSEKHALFFMDLDNFKYVNDNLGHSFGDYLLAELGKRLGENVRSNDFIGRVGGDEFVIFLRDTSRIDIVMGKAKMILSTISEDFSDNSVRHNIQGSLGVAIFPDHGTTYEELYHHADLALYHSKNSGKNTVTMYSEELCGN
ncbi:MAG: diguanylate cyclase [Clostridia bacterium]